MVANNSSKTRKKCHPIYSHIGDRLKTRRLELGLTMNDVAERSDVAYQQIQRYEAALY